MAILQVLVSDGQTQITASADGQTVFAYDFLLEDEDDLKVYRTPDGSTTPVLLTLTTDYTVSGTGTATGGTITMTDASFTIDEDDVITMVRDNVIDRQSGYQTSGDFTAEVVNAEFRRLFQILQNLDGVDARALKYPVGDTEGSDVELPPIDDLKGNTLAFNATTGAPEAGPTADEVSSAQGYATAAAADAVSTAADAVSTAADVVTTGLKVGYAAEWANKAEDSLVTVAAGGDGVDDYSAKHWAAKAETLVGSLGSVVTIEGEWDASAGTFPGAGAAQKGQSWQVTVAGTVDGIAFSVNDRVIALVDNASSSTYAANWLKADYSDTVASVAGEVGVITAAALRTAINVEDGADVTDATNVAAAGAAMLATENQTLTGGFAVTVKDLGTKTTGTHTMDVADRPHQKLVNGGAFTLAPGSIEGSCLLQITNNASAGAITTSGFTFVDGDDFSTTNGDDFLCQVTVINGFSILTVKALQ